MNCVAATIARVAILTLSQMLPHVGKLAGLALLSAILLANPSQANDELAGAGTVGEWRAHLARCAIATASYAIWNILIEADCTRMGEEHALSSASAQRKTEATIHC